MAALCSGSTELDHLVPVALITWLACTMEDISERAKLCIDECYAATQFGGKVLTTFHEIKKKLADIIPFQNSVLGICYAGYRSQGRLPGRGHIHISQVEVMATGAFLAMSSEVVTPQIETITYVLELRR